MTLRIPPALQFLLFALLAWSLSALLPGPNLASPLRVIPGLLLIAAGVALLVLALVAFALARTTVNPLEPAQAATLVTTGLYRISRNPMYLAMALILLGGILSLGNIAALLAPAAFVWSMTELQIKPEERALQSLFGETFTSYRQQTRRWV